MNDAATEPSSPDGPPTEGPVASDRGAAGRLVAASVVLAWLSLALFVATAVILLVPVENRPVQDCGSPGAFLIEGRTDAPLRDDKGRPVAGLDQQGLERAYAHRCTKIVGDRAWPAALTGAGFLLVGLTGLVLGGIGQRKLAKQDLAAWWAENLG